MRKRFYIFFVARDEAGQLRKISIPVHYLYVLIAGIAIGACSLTGIASSYARMLQKISRYNDLRTEDAQLKDSYSRLEQVAKERDIQVASLGSLAREVSSLYGLKSNPAMVDSLDRQDRASAGELLSRSAVRAEEYRSHRRSQRWHLDGPDPEFNHRRLDSRQLRSQPLAGRRTNHRQLRRAHRSI